MKKLLMVLPLAALVAGCQTEEPVPPPYVPTVNVITTGTQAAKVKHVDCKQVILDGVQAQCLVVEDVRRSKTNDGYERVQVLVKNMTNGPIRTKYRFDWQDANGVVMAEPGNDAWEKVTIVGGDCGTFTSLAPKKDCADFRLRMSTVR